MARMIDADALKKAFCEWCGSAAILNPDEVCGRTCGTLDFFDTQPTIEAEPVKHGRWIHTGTSNVFCGKEVECSECGSKVMLSPERFENITEYERYCFHCGAQMNRGADNG